MIYGSVCSGIEAATVAWEPLGWEAAWYSEIEPFPCAVLKHHYPWVPNLGDMTKLDEKAEYRERPIDLLVGGTPCQSFSVAGLREGLADPRGNLALHFLKVLTTKRPRWVVWENVPGVLSSVTVSGGRASRDFGTFLAGLRECGYGFAYRVLDAQYFGLAQRRKRVFVVGYLGDWRPAAAVLFEREGLRGDPQPSREAGKGTSHDVAPSIGASGRGFERAGETRGQDPVVVDKAVNAHPSRRMDPSGETLVTHALKGEGFDGSEDGSGRGVPLVAFDARQSDVIQHGEKSGPLDGNGQTIGVLGVSSVRRLTPRECERLQGFPDDYTLIPWRKGLAPDGPRYKALGNSMAVPVMRWIGQRIQMVEEILGK